MTYLLIGIFLIYIAVTLVLDKLLLRKQTPFRRSIIHSILLFSMFFVVFTALKLSYATMNRGSYVLLVVASLIASIVGNMATYFFIVLKNNLNR